MLLTGDVSRIARPSDDATGGRWAVGGVVMLLVGAAIALVVTSGISYRRARAVDEVLTRGEADGVTHAVVAALLARSGPPDAEALAAIVAAEHDAGLRYVAIVEPDGRVRVSAGDSVEPETVGEDVRPEPAGDPAPGGPPPPGWRLRTVGDRVRVSARTARAPGPPPWLAGGGFAPLDPQTGGPGGGFDPGAGAEPPAAPATRDGDATPVFGGEPADEPRGRRRPWRGRLGPPPFVIELTPTLSAALRDEAGRALWVGFASAAGLLIAAGLLWRWVKHRDRLIGRLAHERRLAALGEMSAVLAHELRNPLASLKGNAELLVEALDGRERDRTKAVRVVDEALRLERLTNDLLEFVRTGKIARREASPGDVLRTAARGLGDGGQAIEIMDTAAPARWSIDPERIEQVLTNLLENAVQAGPASLVTASVGVEQRRLVYRVRDRGPGLPAGAPDAIFEPFHTTRVRGIGLGLAVARRLVELHGGTLTAANHPGGGAEFTVAIPEA
ncbi:MAG: hypothetical protein K8W52_07605 [Deltaproteobacteria bacterium]|nr:hypothetical protein [Deltaproteobacteria bacterium]